MSTTQHQYIDMLRTSRSLEALSKTFVEDAWWTDLCRSADNDVFHELLFDKELFDGDGVLEYGSKEYKKIKQSLMVLYVHIAEKFGAETLREWKLSWEIDSTNVPFIHATNDTIGSSLSMTQPKSGFIDKHPSPLPVTDSTQPTQSSSSSTSIPEPMSQEDIAAHHAQLHEDPELRVIAGKHIEAHWWDDLCRSADNEAFHSVLFEKHVFNEDGVVALWMPALKKIRSGLQLAYVHIIEKYGETAAEDWKVIWEIDDENEPFMRVINGVTGQEFGMMPPKSGWTDYANELKTMRFRRNSGKNFKIPAAHMQYYTPPKPVSQPTSNAGTDTDALGPQDPNMVNVPLTPAKIKAFLEKTLPHDENYDDWFVVAEDGTKLVFDDDAAGPANNVVEDEFEKARRMGEDNKGYVYDRKDSMPARRRRGWFC